MAVLKPIPYSSSHFSTHISSATISAEISKLTPSVANWLSNLYDDACDRGIAIISERTGVVTTWVIAVTVTDREGDICAWHFVPTSETVRKNPNLGNYRVVVFND